MHNGSLKTLNQVGEFYSTRAASCPPARVLGLSPEQVEAIVAFMEALTDQ